ncbi:u11 u12 small nuclear ribonucleoprotein 35 kda [Stylonychia lemnae]|uniref:U11 u12 small nuclear ribonucleoprotein 35 kDa n=1 Tax=Stylonychia lemnae TaxID=5949 RepID=A0A078B7R0_STYLE|nr:u11 u12 small nuclear ribonucleoprotein 35 kda [Stylonychia lemnae]|eukprot:CDW89332.1 u11 u12 small nuclear ribonucleoprotein 35 kda [Stylonychia lemnae]
MQQRDNSEESEQSQSRINKKNVQWSKQRRDDHLQNRSATYQPKTHSRSRSREKLYNRRSNASSHDSYQSHQSQSNPEHRNQNQRQFQGLSTYTQGSGRGNTYHNSRAMTNKYQNQRQGFKDGRGKQCHDNALYRTSKSTYTSEFDSSQNKSKIFVCGLLPKTSDRDLFHHFERYGSIREINIVRDKVTGSNKGYAFIDFEDREDAFKAYSQANKSTMANGSRDVIVDLVRSGGKQPEFKPRRLGGGYGGKVKGSQIRFGGRDKPFF